MGPLLMSMSAPSRAVPLGITACPFQHTGTCSLTFPRGQLGGRRLAKAAASRGENIMLVSRREPTYQYAVVHSSLA